MASVLMRRSFFMTKHDNNKSIFNKNNNLGLGIALGVVIGAILGSINGDMLIYIVFGAAFGAGYGLLMKK